MLTDKKLNAKLGKFKKTEMVYIINRQFKMLGINNEISSDLEILLYSNHNDQRDDELLLKNLVDDSKTWLNNHYPKQKLVRLGLC